MQFVFLGLCSLVSGVRRLLASACAGGYNRATLCEHSGRSSEGRPPIFFPISIIQ